MFKFFRKIREKLFSENQFSKYILYAIGEIILVVIGILIALQINNWNEYRKNKKVLEGHLVFLIEDIESDKNQLTKLIEDREASLFFTTGIINAYKNEQSINSKDFLDAFNFIVVERKFDNNTIGFDKVKNSALFDTKEFHNIRNLIREYKKTIEEAQFVESKQNASTEIMESELLHNGFYDKYWDDFRAYYQPKMFKKENSAIDYLNGINQYSQVKAIFIRNEWALPFLIDDYKTIISTGEKLKDEINNFLEL